MIEKSLLIATAIILMGLMLEPAVEKLKTLTNKITAVAELTLPCTSKSSGSGRCYDPAK